MQQTASATPSRQERRVRRTRAMILAGFIQLMQQKPVKDISVRELADLVDINRSTFYLHYTDIYDLLEQTENGLMDQFLAIIDKNHTSLTLQEFSDKLEQFFAILAENQPLCRALMSPNGDIAFVRKLEKLIVDGRIHPARIEEMVEKAQKEVETMMREEGEAATLEVGVHGLHPELIRLLGKMKFRTSYGQNALKHSIEVAHLSGLLAGELGLDVRVAKRAGLLHDIGKSIDHDAGMEGSHVSIGVDLCRKYKESATIINAVEAHHGDVEPQSLIACIVQAADAISAARPGARRETLETYTTRLKSLEDIANGFKGVDKTFAIQAGREIRVMVVPEQVTDADMVLLARDISKKIESELEYPGTIKVNLIRESRVTDYAK